MCGIAGVFGPGASRASVEVMANRMVHRGPDDAGVFVGPEVALAHRRLSIVDLSSAGHQPMSTRDGRYTIVFNGEIYNHKDLRATFESRAWASNTDTEVVLALFEREGPACLSKLSGMFSFAIFDAREDHLFLARDRLGIKPLFFAYADQGFVFASEIRPLLRFVPSRANDGVIYDFLARDFYAHTDETFFLGIQKLPPASYTFVKRSGAITPVSYWDLAEHTARIEVPERDREAWILEALERAVRSHLMSDVPVGVALSGGLDSSLLLGLLDRAHPDPTKVEAFSFCFREPEYSERPFVQAMAEATGRKVHFYEMAPEDFVRGLETYVDSQEEPFAGTPIAAYHQCYALARERGFIVVMDGSGLDEAFAGYTRFLPAFWSDLAASGDETRLDRELGALGISRERARSMMSEIDEGRGQDLTASSKADCLHVDFVERARRPAPQFATPFPSRLHNLMYRELRYTKLPRALSFRDRLSMASSTELRPPFLDHEVLARAFALPGHELITLGQQKAILRRAASKFLPDSIRLASKRSVQTPQREWFRGPLAEWVRSWIEDSGFLDRGWVDPVRARSAMNAYFGGVGDNSFFLWQWLNLEVWARQFLDVK